MQAASVAAMAAQSVLVASPSSLPLLSLISNPNLTHSQSLNSSFHGVSLKFPRQSLALSLSAAAPKRPLAAVAATEKTVAVLKGTSTVEGVVTLTQDDDGLAEATMVDSEILLSDPCVEPDDELGPVAAVPKKRTSRSKKRIRKNVWKRKGYVAALKAYSLAKSILTGKSTSFMTENLKKDT